MNSRDYVLITAARNEDRYIENSIKSVCQQSLKPNIWIIASDGSTDTTDDIVKRYARKYNFIRYKRIDSGKNRNFSSKVYALNSSYKELKNTGHNFIGILDADITLPKNYYEKIINEFNNNSKLGLAGGYVYDKIKGGYINRVGNTEKSVAGGIQVFRRKCYDDIQGLQPMKLGGEDWVAEVKSRKKGWDVRAYAEIKVHHQRPTGGALGNNIKASIRAGEVAFSVGSLPVFEILKAIRRIKEKPYLLCSLCRIYGYFRLYQRKEKKKMSNEFVSYLRSEQRNRILQLLRVK